MAGCLHQRDPEGGITGGSGGITVAVAEATSAPNDADNTGKIVVRAEDVAENPPNDADATACTVTRAVADALTAPSEEDATA